MERQFDTRAICRTAYAFDTHPSRKARRYRHRYAELWRLFRSDLRYEDIGKILNTTRQAVHQLYELWFAPHLGPGIERLVHIQHMRRLLEKEAQLLKRIRSAREDPTFVFLAAEAARHGKEIEPLLDYTGLRINRSATPVYRCGQRYVRVYRRTMPFKPNHGSPCTYASFHVTESMLKGIHACALFVDIAGHEREVFVVRAHTLRQIIRQKAERVWTFYIPLGDFASKGRKLINLRGAKNAWMLI